MSSDNGTVILARRRETVFVFAIGFIGFAGVLFCLLPTVLPTVTPRSLFAVPPLEHAFYSLFSWIIACWLFSWVSAVCSWDLLSRAGQWLGILLLCLDQAILFGVWRTSLEYGFFSFVWVVALFLQMMFAGYFFAFFTMPALTLSGQSRLTALATLAALLPWLLGQQSLIAGTHVMAGLFLSH